MTNYKSDEIRLELQNFWNTFNREVKPLGSIAFLTSIVYHSVVRDADTMNDAEVEAAVQRYIDVLHLVEKVESGPNSIELIELLFSKLMALTTMPTFENQLKMTKTLLGDIDPTEAHLNDLRILKHHLMSITVMLVDLLGRLNGKTIAIQRTDSDFSVSETTLNVNVLLEAWLVVLEEASMTNEIELVKEKFPDLNQ